MRFGDPFTLVFLASLASPALAQTVPSRHYVIKNNCPETINFAVNGAIQGSILPGGNATRDFPLTWSGQIWWGRSYLHRDGSGANRAGFYGEGGSSYYYVIVDPNIYNSDLTITPLNGTQANGFCAVDICGQLACQSYEQTPTPFPPHGPSAPKPPLYACPDAQGYEVTFCPTGKFPSEDGIPIHPNGDDSKCLDVRGAVYENGTPVQIYDCNGSGAQKWIINRGGTKLRVAGQNFCLDAGSNPASGVGMKIWQCYDNLPAQAWYYTDDARIALTGQGLCLDLTNGVKTNSNQVQSWQCTNNNVNQIWTP